MFGYTASISVQLSGKTQADHLKNKGQERPGMFFKRGKSVEYIKAGSSFRRKRGDATIETARVLSVASDSFGIPHVRFEVVFEKPSMASRVVDGPRVLALNTFADMYEERVAS